jgi:hypothetical protein
MQRRSLVKIAATAALAGALVVPTGADARNGRVAAGIIGGFAAGALIGAATGGYWGPGPYYYGYPGPVYYYPPAPYYAPYGYYRGYYGCYRRSVWNGRRWRRIVVCN